MTYTIAFDLHMRYGNIHMTVYTMLFILHSQDHTVRRVRVVVKDGVDQQVAYFWPLLKTTLTIQVRDVGYVLLLPPHLIPT